MPLARLWPSHTTRFDVVVLTGVVPLTLRLQSVDSVEAANNLEVDWACRHRHRHKTCQVSFKFKVNTQGGCKERKVGLVSALNPCS